VNRLSSRHLGRLALASALWALSGCGSDSDHLSGSISTSASLQFDVVRAEWLVDELSVRYVSRSDLLTSDAARITVPQAQAKTDVDIALGGTVRLEHYWFLANDEGRLAQEPPFPAVDHGTVRFGTLAPDVGGSVKGSFHAVFVTGDTLDGDFDATVIAPGTDG